MTPFVPFARPVADLLSLPLSLSRPWCPAGVPVERPVSSGEASCPASCGVSVLPAPSASLLTPCPARPWCPVVLPADLPVVSGWGSGSVSVG